MARTRRQSRLLNMSEAAPGSRSITADTALRLGKWFGTSPAFWLNLQKSYELRKAALEIGEEIETIPTRIIEPAS